MKATQQQSQSNYSVKKVLSNLAITCLLQNFNPFTEPTNLVKADQPVHCLRESLFGVWNFHVNSEKNNINLFETKELCTHNVPNRVQVMNNQHHFQFENEDIYRVNIMDDYKAEAVFCKGDKKCSNEVIQGHWTSIYDQALNVELDNGMRFLANFRYNMKQQISKDPFKEAVKNGIAKFGQIESGDYDKFDSDCSKTMVGFVQNIPSKTGQSFSLSNHQVQCFHGVQEKHYDIEKTEAHNTGKMKYNKIISHHSVTPEHIQGEIPKNENNLKISSSKSTKQNSRAQSKSKKKRHNMHLEHKPSEQMDLLISAINEADLGWKADVCKYQKHHSLYGEHCDKDLNDQPLSLGQVSDNDNDDDTNNGGDVQQADAQQADAQQGDDQSLVDGNNNKKQFGVEGDKDFQQTLAQAQNFMKNYQKADDIPDNQIPETLDYRDINGYDFTSYYRDQGHCGSCYTISFTQVMEARLKLKYGKQPPMLSPQMLMTCNYMNEGCEGGWPHFNVFLAENGHLVSEECAPYQHQTRGDNCKNYQQCKPTAKVQQSYLVGGGWGATSEKKMMKEILRNGPINGDFQAPSMFSIYKDGIFSEKGLIGLKEKSEEMLLLAQTNSSQSEDSDKHKDNKLSDTTLNDKGIAWMDMNHSVVIVGWGKDEKTNTKYWIVRNSYGPKWGMNGDFLVQRGNNDFGMEVEQIAFDPLMCSDDSTDVCIGI